MVRDDPAAMVASHVLAAYLDAVPLGLTARLADWLTQHVAAAAGRGVRARWQWEITMLPWIVEVCGLPELLAASRLAAEDLLAEAGFAARAMRQAPFTGWRHGVAGCRPGLLFPGSNTSDREARYIGRVGLGLPTSAIEGLLGLVGDAAQTGTGRGMPLRRSNRPPLAAWSQGVVSAGSALQLRPHLAPRLPP